MGRIGTARAARGTTRLNFATAPHTLRAGTLKPPKAVAQPLQLVRSAERTTCAAISGGTPLFDGDHLSGYGNELPYPSFVKFLLSR